MSKTKTKSGIKMLAAHAKERLKSGFYKKRNNYVNYNELVRSSINGNSEYDSQFYEKVKSIIEEGNVINPLTRLVDQDYIKTLTYNARQRYLLEISDRYKRVKDEILSKMNQ